MASPLASRDTGLIDNEYVQLWAEPAKVYNGSLIYYGPSNTTVTATPTVIDKRSKTTCTTTATPNCHSSHEARNEPCEKLVTELQADGDVSVPQSPRQICYEGESSDNQYCCVSWHNKVPGLVKVDLYRYAERIMVHCTSNGISGKIDNVLVDATCTDTDASFWRVKFQIRDGDTIESDFIGASPEECQAWALEKQRQVLFIEYNVVAIVDKRSAQDKTILMSWYIFPELCQPPFMQFPPFGTLPRRQDVNTWINFRIKYEDAPSLASSWTYGDPDLTYPAYLGNREAFTDEHGVFDVAKAEEWSLTYDPYEDYAGPPRL